MSTAIWLQMSAEKKSFRRSNGLAQTNFNAIIVKILLTTKLSRRISILFFNKESRNFIKKFRFMINDILIIFL